MATLYVNGSTGDDARTYAQAQNSATPWLTIGRAAWGSTDYSVPSAANAAQAGDVVLISAGTYTTTGRTISDGDSKWSVALNPANSGTAGNPITFRGVGTVTIQTTGGQLGPTIGAKQRDYIVWDNIHIDDANCGTVSDTAPVVFFETTGSQLLNSTIVGTFRSWFDNYSGVRLQTTYSNLIKNTTISDITGNGGTNNAGILFYDTQDLIIDHSDISAANTGIYVKGDSGAAPAQTGTIIRFNRIHDNAGRGIELGAAELTRVYQNIIKGNQLGIAFQDFGAPQNSNITIQNNVIVSTNVTSDAGTTYIGTTNIVNARVFNNIFYGPFSEAVNIGTAAPGDQTYEHNVYYGYDAWGSYSGAQHTFADWTGTGKDSASPASITSNPLFVDDVDYRLQAGSPAKNLGVDILDLDGDSSTTDNVDAGAYVTGSETIGIETTGDEVVGAASAVAIGRCVRWI